MSFRHLNRSDWPTIIYEFFGIEYFFKGLCLCKSKTHLLNAYQVYFPDEINFISIIFFNIWIAKHSYLSYYNSRYKYKNFKQMVT